MKRPGIGPEPRAAALGALFIALSLAGPEAATAKMKIPMVGGFSVDGKKGPFIKQVADRKPDKPATGTGTLNLGDDLVNQGEVQARRLRMPETEKRLEALIARIQTKWPYAQATPIKVFMLGLDEYGAHALPDGSIAIPIGLIDQVKSDDELVFVLSHELSHIRLNHFARAAAAMQQRRAISRLVQGYMVIATATHTQVSSSGGQVVLTPDKVKIAQAAHKASAVNDALHLLVQVGFEAAWSRDQEDEADALGFDLTELSSYGGDSAAAAVFDSLQADSDRREAAARALQGQLQESIGFLVSQAAQQANQQAGPQGGDVWGKFKQSFEQGARDKLISWVAGFAAQKHRAPAVRKKGIADYSNAAYPDGLPLRDNQQVWLKAARVSKEMVQARLAVTSVQAAEKSRADGDLDGALKQISKAMQTSFKTAPLIYDTAASIYADKGEIDRADKLFATAENGGDQTLEGYLKHVDMLIVAGRYEPARKLTAAAIAQLQRQRATASGKPAAADDKPFLPAMISISFKTGKDAEGIAYLDRCVSYDDPDLRQLCVVARLDLGQSYDKLTLGQKAEVDRAVRQAANKSTLDAPFTAMLNGFNQLKAAGQPAKTPASH